MSILRLLRAAFTAIARNRMRSLLTSLGIIIGVSAVIVMVAIGEGSQRRISASINSLGTNLLIVFPGAATSGGAKLGAGSFNRFTMDDVKSIAENSSAIDAVSAVVRTGAQVIGGGTNWATSIYGVDPEYFEIRNWELDNGEFFTEKDVLANRKVAVIGKTVADELFPNDDPIGNDIRVRNVPMKVVGVLKSKGQSGMGQDQDDVILAPTTTVLYRLKGGTWVDMINASAVSTSLMTQAVAELRQALRQSHNLREGEDDDFTIANQAEITAAVTETTKTMTYLLGSIAAISLVVGGIGIMNIMLVSVTERTREIGVRLAVGARESDVLIQFLTEAMSLSLAGGLIGVAISFLAVALLNKWSELQPTITPEIVVLSFVFAAAIGVFFGFYPARKAAALDPIEALRHE
jgi:putative ABC transport system permease protein